MIEIYHKKPANIDLHVHRHSRQKYYFTRLTDREVNDIN
jgi:hypothetical protein